MSFRQINVFFSPIDLQCTCKQLRILAVQVSRSALQSRFTESTQNRHRTLFQYITMHGHHKWPIAESSLPRPPLNMFVWVKRPHSFKYGTKLSSVWAKWHWFIWHQIVSVLWLSKHSAYSYDCKTGFGTKMLDPSSVASIAVNKSSPREPVP